MAWRTAGSVIGSWTEVISDDPDHDLAQALALDGSWIWNMAERTVLVRTDQLDNLAGGITVVEDPPRPMPNQLDPVPFAVPGPRYGEPWAKVAATLAGVDASAEQGDLVFDTGADKWNWYDHNGTWQPLGVAGLAVAPPTGVTAVDTANIQKQIDTVTAAQANGQPVPAIVLREGGYSIGAPFVVTGIYGFRIVGQGEWLTMLSPTTALSGGPLFKFVNCYHPSVENLSILGTGIANDNFWAVEATKDAAGPFVTSKGLTLLEVLVDGGTGVNSVRNAVRWTTNGSGTTANTANDLNNDYAHFERVNIWSTNGPPLSIEHQNSVQHTFRAITLINTAGVARFAGGSADFDGVTIGGASPVTGVYAFDFLPAVGAGTPRYTHGTFVRAFQGEIAGLGLVRHQGNRTTDVAMFTFSGDGTLVGMPAASLGVNFIEWDAAANVDNLLKVDGVNLDQGQAGLTVNIASAAAEVSFTDSILGMAIYVNNGMLSFRNVRHTVGSVTMTNTGTLSETMVIGGGRTTSTQKINGSVVTSPPAVTFANPTNPAGTTSTSEVMAGLAVAFTSNSTGKVLVRIDGLCGTATAVSAIQMRGRYGTGTAPANGAAQTGTQFPQGPLVINPSSANTRTPFAAVGLITGLTVGTPYWFDLSFQTGNASNQANLANLAVSIQECA